MASSAGEASAEDLLARALEVIDRQSVRIDELASQNAELRKENPQLREQNAQLVWVNEELREPAGGQAARLAEANDALAVLQRMVFGRKSEIASSSPGTLVSASSVTVESSTQLQVTLNAGSVAATGARNITVIEPGPTADTCSNCLTIDPAPAIGSLNPDSLAPGTTTAVTVTGSGFASGLAVITNIPGATVGTPSNVTSTSFTVQVTVPASAASGTYHLIVTNPDGGAASAALTVT